MYLPKIKCYKDGKTRGYRPLVECYRTARGLLQRVVAYLGERDVLVRLSIQLATENRMDYQADLFDELELQWIEVNLNVINFESLRDFGDIWLALELIK